jgi:hypothetical protein
MNKVWANIVSKAEVKTTIENAKKKMTTPWNMVVANGLNKQTPPSASPNSLLKEKVGDALAKATELNVKLAHNKSIMDKVMAAVEKINVRIASLTQSQTPIEKAKAKAVEINKRLKNSGFC